MRTRRGKKPSDPSTALANWSATKTSMRRDQHEIVGSQKFDHDPQAWQWALAAS
jgi:hypothetical protein